MATDNTVDFVVTQNGIIVEDFAASEDGSSSRVGQAAPPMTRVTPDDDIDVDAPTTSDAAALLPPVRTARDVVAALAARGSISRYAKRQVGADRA